MARLARGFDFAAVGSRVDLKLPNGRSILTENVVMMMAQAAEAGEFPLWLNG